MNVNVFWDNSNIWLVGKKVCSQMEPGYEDAFRIHFSNLISYVVSGRTVEYCFAGGSLPPQNDALWEMIKKAGVELELQQRGAMNGKEVAVDQALHFAMLARIIDSEKPGTMVLLTGDGNGYQDGKGFIAQLERAKRNGWQIEVYSWDAGCNRHLKKFAEDNGKYIPLEPAYNNITFINNHRWAKNIS